MKTTSKTEQNFKTGSRGSSSILKNELTKKQVLQFMQTSFYLPIDVLKHPDWVVDKIQIVSGVDFLRYFYSSVTHTLEDKELLCAAHFVALSGRRNVCTQKRFVVAKIWYGAEPR